MSKEQLIKQMLTDMASGRIELLERKENPISQDLRQRFMTEAELIMKILKEIDKL